MSDNYSKIHKKLVQYYQDLLIVQYHDKPKAKATIKAQVDEILCNMLEQRVKDSFDVDTAVGKQLDIIGKWVGVSRIFKGQKFDSRPWFSLPSYDQNPDAFQHGFSTYDTFEENGGFLTYDFLLGTSNLLSDDDFRLLIKLKIIRNSVLHSPKAIDEAIFRLFKGVKTDWSKVLTDEEGYNNVLKAKHSTFDKSKFTVVGSPTITDDGVASGFDKTSFLKSKVNISPDYSSLEITTPPFKVTNTDGTEDYVIIGKDSFAFSWWWDNITVRIYNNKNANDTIYRPSQKIARNDVLQLRIQYQNKQYICSYIILTKDAEWHTMPVVQGEAPTTPVSISYINYGRNSVDGASDYYYHDGSIDLKQFSISVDGKEVFSGNKTGIDIIKPDNFTKVGNPVISEDGVASGFGEGYIKSSNINIKYANELKFLISKTPNTKGLLICSDREKLLVWQTNNNKLQVQWREPSSSSSVFKVDVTVKPNTLLYEIIIKKDTLTIYEDGTLNSVSNINTNNIDDNFNFIKLGVYGNSPNPDFSYTGSIDLNAFKIYVDGNLVYQPLLRIPYTLSSNNSKIVDNVYKDRLADVYNYKDAVVYYTIDEEKRTYTRPTSTNTMYTSWENCMEMNFNYNPNLYGIVNLGIEKRCFPIPSGVKANFVEVNNDKIK